MSKRGGGGKKSHRKLSYHALADFGTVYCKKCCDFIQRGPLSDPNDSEFLKRHQYSKKCKTAAEAFVRDDNYCMSVAQEDHLDTSPGIGGAVSAGFEQDDDTNGSPRAMYVEDIGDDHFLFAPEMNEHDVTNTDYVPGRTACVMGPVQIEETPERELQVMDIYKLEASEEILKIQIEKIRLFEEGEIIEKFEKIRTPKGKHHAKKWEDLVDLYELGIDCKISRPIKDKMLATFTRILERNEVDHFVTIPKTWASIDDLFTCSYAEMFNTKDYFYELPEEFFGKFELPLNRRNPLAKMRGLGLDVKAVLAEALLEIDPSQFVMEYKRVDGILDGFESSDDFRKISADDKFFDEAPPYGHPISLCVTIRTDETTCNNSGSETEQSVLLSILNAKGNAYKVLFLGYAPIHKPYSDAVLKSLLKEAGSTLLECEYT